MTNPRHHGAMAPLSTPVLALALALAPALAVPPSAARAQDEAGESGGDGGSGGSGGESTGDTGDAGESGGDDAGTADAGTADAGAADDADRAAPRPPMTAEEVDAGWRAHRIASVVGLGLGGGATAAGIALWAADTGGGAGPALVAGGAAGLVPGAFTLTGSLVIDALAGRTGRSSDDLFRWRSGMYRACLGAGLLVAGSVIQYFPLLDDAGDPTLAGLHVAGAVYGAVGGLLLAEGYAAAQRGLWYPRPVYGLSFVTAALLIIPKAIHAGIKLSPATWDDRHGIESLGWVGAGMAVALVELAATHESRRRARIRRQGGRTTLDRGAVGSLAVVVPWVDARSAGVMGLAVAGRW